ncbi:MAG: hypothetical protein PHO94_08900 [Petrimonas sp.]|nr:hypothetical protein [Petrimonas sp.]
MKNISVFILLIAVLLVSCSKNEDEIIEKNDKLKIGFKSEKETAEIFELMEFSLVSEREFYSNELSQAYDSIVWSVKSINGTQKIYYHTPNSSSLKLKWSTNFFFPGNYTMYLTGYRNNTIVQKDSAAIIITNNKDFLGINWKEIDGTDKYNTGYYDAFSSYNFSTFTTRQNGIASAALLRINDKDKGDFNYAEESKEILYDYICKLYSKPVYTEKDDINLLMEKYKTLFRNPQKNTVPVCIWTTKTSNIALINHEEMIYLEGAKFRIYAEPKN